MNAVMPRVSTCLWFDREGEEAANFYISVVPDSRITAISRYGAGAPMPKGLALVVNFELAGTPYMILNGGPMFRHSEAASIVVACDDQPQIDGLWAKLTANGGKAGRCGWLTDRFGVSWQIAPRQIGEWMTSPDLAASGRVFAALMPMTKVDIATLQRAFEGR